MRMGDKGEEQVENDMNLFIGRIVVFSTGLENLGTGLIGRPR